jgi:hypothetical protein
MKNLHIIKTDEPSRLGRFVDTRNLFLRTPNDLPRGENVNVYITVDDTIKIGDREIIDNECRKLKFTKNETRIGKKVILSDDPKLVKDGVQEISDDFLEFLVQNPSCEVVKIDLVPVNEFGSGITVGGYGFDKFKYKIILPKEEPKQEFPIVNGSSVCTITVTDEIGKPIPYCGELEEPKQKTTMKETLEEVNKLALLFHNTYEKLAPSFGYETRQDTKEFDFKSNNGKLMVAVCAEILKWQQEQDKNKYSEQDMDNYAEYCIQHFAKSQIGQPYLSAKEWFSQFKKK